MFISAQSAMRKRRMIESPSCAVAVMQQPDLGRLGRLTGPPIVSLGDVVVGGLPVTGSTAAPVVSTSGLFGMSWTTIGILGALLLGGVMWYRSRSGGAGGMLLPTAAPRRRRRSFKLPKVALTTAALLAGGGYVAGKYLTQSGA